MNKFIIKDFKNNTCFKGIEFNSFEGAWDYVFDMFPNGDDDLLLMVYFVVEKE